MTAIDTLNNVADIYPLTPAQKGLLYQTALANSDDLYRTQSRDNILGEFSSEVFRQALNYLVQRHGSLRCLFLHLGLDEPVCVVRQAVELPFLEHDLTGLAAAEQQARLDEFAQQSMQRKLALDVAPLFRVTLVKLSDSLSHVIFDIHHLIFDGWSSSVFFNELQYVYGALLAGGKVDLPAAGQYKDHVLKLDGQNNQRLLQKWSVRLKGFTKPSSLPLSRGRELNAADNQYANSSFRRFLDKSTSHRLSEFARANRVTMSTLIEAAWSLTLSRYNDKEDVLIGVTLNGRSAQMSQHERTFGLFVNTLPMRVRCQESMPLNQWLESVQREKAFLNESESVSLSDIHVESELPAGKELFEALLVYQEFPDIGPVTDPPIRFSSAGIHENSPLPLVIHIFNGTEIEFLALHIEEQLPEPVAQQLLDHCLNILRNLAKLRSSTGLCLSDVAMLSEDELDQLKRLCSGEQTLAKPGQSLHGLFLEQVGLSPEKTAIRDSSRALSYAQLLDQARIIEHYLTDCKIGAGDVVAICVERSVNQYVAMLGTLFSGAAFMPLDPLYPPTRQNFMLDDCGAKLVLTDSQTNLVFATGNHTVIDIDALPIADGSDLQQSHSKLDGEWNSGARPDVLSDPESAAYVMYTSGSTGVPKGVVGSHRATLNRFEWMWDAYPFEPDEVCCQKTSLSFVDSIWELFGPLLKGVPVVILDDASVVNADRFVEELKAHRITRVVLLPSYLSVLLDSVDQISSALADLRICTLSGEALPSHVANRFLEKLPDCRLLNLYGSTEVSADTSYFAVEGKQEGNHVAIGRPIRGCQIHVLDRLGRPMPQGAIGELCVSGVSLANGYIGQEEGMSHERFRASTVGEGGMYLTGDLGRYGPDGILEHAGRRDSQIKIRGHRIELVEIEQTISRFDGVRAALLNVPEEDRLHAYYRVKLGESVDNSKLEAHLRASLPDHMIPQFLTPIDEFPRLPNGKINRRALPIPQTLNTRTRVAPRTSTEKTVSQIWQELLSVPEPSVFDNFVASGGSSLSGMRFNARLYREFGAMVLPRVLLTANLAQIALQVNPKDLPDESASVQPVDLIEPLFFVDAGKQLYGMLHLPETLSMKSPVLLCGSVGHEYMRLHRSYQMLAIELARRGHMVLRFDYSGLGDSSGESSEVTMEQWHSDTRAAARLLRDRSAGGRVTVVGVRLGVPIVFGACLQEVERIVAWDPVCDGQDYLAHLDALHRHAMNSLDRYRFRQRKSGPWERFGYTYSKELLAQLGKIDQSNWQLPDSAKLNLVTTGQAIEKNDMGVNRMLERDAIEHQHVADIELWADFDAASYMAFPQSVTALIADLIEAKQDV